MSSTAVVAWWGAVLSSIVFAWDVYKYFHAGPNLRFSVQPHMKGINMPLYDGQTLIMAKVTNRGDRPTTITNLGYLYFVRRPLFLSKKPDKAAVVPSPSLTQPLPFELKPGAEWVGLAIQDVQIEEWAKNGILYMVLYHSHNKTPLRKQVIIE